jgi:hypothetical protein
MPNIYIVTCYLLTRRIINWVADCFISIYWIYIRRSLQSLITLLITSHEPATSSGMNYSWGTLIPDCFCTLPWPDCCYNQCLAPYIVSVIHCCQLLVCSLPWYMRFYRPLLSCNNTPIVPVARLPCLQNCWKQFSCIRCLAMGVSIQPSTQHVQLWFRGTELGNSETEQVTMTYPTITEEANYILHYRKQFYNIYASNLFNCGVQNTGTPISGIFSPWKSSHLPVRPKHFPLPQYALQKESN